MSICLVLFYSLRLWNFTYCMFVCTLRCSLFFFKIFFCSLNMTETVEYVNCISLEGYDPVKQCTGKDINLLLIVRLQSWIFRESGVSLDRYYIQVYSEPECQSALKIN